MGREVAWWLRCGTLCALLAVTVGGGWLGVAYLLAGGLAALLGSLAWPLTALAVGVGVAIAALGVAAAHSWVLVTRARVALPPPAIYWPAPPAGALTEGDPDGQF